MLNFGRCRLSAASPDEYSVRAVDLVKESVKELQKQGLARNVRK